MKLAKELSKRATGRTLYILDEPTTGLHFHDVAKLLEVLHELVEGEYRCGDRAQSRGDQDGHGRSIGPEGGDAGGEIVAAGTPEDVIAVKKKPHGASRAGFAPRRAEAEEAVEGGAERGAAPLIQTILFSKNSGLKFCGGVSRSGRPSGVKVHQIPQLRRSRK